LHEGDDEVDLDQKLLEFPQSEEQTKEESKMPQANIFQSPSKVTVLQQVIKLQDKDDDSNLLIESANLAALPKRFDSFQSSPYTQRKFSPLALPSEHRLVIP